MTQGTGPQKQRNLNQLKTKVHHTRHDYCKKCIKLVIFEDKHNPDREKEFSTSFTKTKFLRL